MYCEQSEKEKECTTFKDLLQSSISSTVKNDNKKLLPSDLDQSA